jgi:hypothetical protein
LRERFLVEKTGLIEMEEVQLYKGRGWSVYDGNKKNYVKGGNGDEG